MEKQYPNNNGKDGKESDVLHLPPSVNATQDVDAAEVKRSLDKPIDFPYETDLVFGPGTKKNLLSILTDPVLTESDLLFITGLNMDELTDYLVVMPEYRDLRKRGFELTQKMGKKLASQAPYYLKQTFSNYLRSGNVPDWDNTRITQTITLIEKIREISQIPYNSQRNGIVENMRMDVMTMFLFHLQMASEHTAYEEPLAAVLNVIKKRSWGKPDQYGKSMRSFSDMLDMRFEYIYNDLDIFNEWNKGIDLSGDKEKAAKNKSENEELAGKIADLSYLRKFELGNVSCEDFIFSATSISETHSRAIRSLYVGEIKIRPDGKENEMLLYLDRITGNLVLPATFIPISLVVGDNLYEEMRHAVLKSVLEALERRGEDYSWTPIKKSETTAGSDVADVTSLVSEEEVESEIENEEKTRWREEARATAQAYAREQRVKKMALNDADKENNLETKEVANRENVEALRSLKGSASKDIIAAYTSILGEPRSSGSSHFIFYGRGGKSYPIPNHGTEPVKLGILQRSFDVLGVSPVELLKAI